ncbi:sugar transferase [Exiguobacterium acetylicum]|uniref:sugar transferase n=1 Tax=Exiguobacterium acetylicum TaxID=41170 RepID=UPI00397759FE
MSTTNIILFLYNRPEHTRKTMNSIFKSINEDFIKLHIFVDGPKNKEDQDKQIEIKKIIKEYKSINKDIQLFEYYSEENKGLASSIINGVSKIFVQEDTDFVIVLEDDILISTRFVQYMNYMNEKLKGNQNIWSISGFNPIAKELEEKELLNSGEYFLHGRASSWGWATWKDRWEKNDWSTESLLKKIDPLTKEKIKNTSPDILPMLDDQLKERIDSWAVRWVVNQFLNKSETVYPRLSLVQNIGFDDLGTHTKKINKVSYKLQPVEENFEFKNIIKPSQKIDAILYEHYKPSLVQNIARILKNIGLSNFVNIIKKMRS